MCDIYSIYIYIHVYLYAYMYGIYVQKDIMQHHVTYPHELRDTPLLWPASQVLVDDCSEEEVLRGLVRRVRSHCDETVKRAHQMQRLSPEIWEGLMWLGCWKEECGGWVKPWGTCTVTKFFFLERGRVWDFFRNFCFDYIYIYINKHTQIYIVYLQVFVWSF